MPRRSGYLEQSAAAGVPEVRAEWLDSDRPAAQAPWRGYPLMPPPGTAHVGDGVCMRDKLDGLWPSAAVTPAVLVRASDPIPRGQVGRLPRDNVEAEVAGTKMVFPSAAIALQNDFPCHSYALTRRNTWSGPKPCLLDVPLSHGDKLCQRILGRALACPIPVLGPGERQQLLKPVIQGYLFTVSD